MLFRSSSWPRAACTLEYTPSLEVRNCAPLTTNVAASRNRHAATPKAYRIVTILEPFMILPIRSQIGRVSTTVYLFRELRLFEPLPLRLGSRLPVKVGDIKTTIAGLPDQMHVRLLLIVCTADTTVSG